MLLGPMIDVEILFPMEDVATVATHKVARDGDHSLYRLLPKAFPIADQSGSK